MNQGDDSCSYPCSKNNRKLVDLLPVEKNGLATKRSSMLPKQHCEPREEKQDDHMNDSPSEHDGGESDQDNMQLYHLDPLESSSMTISEEDDHTSQHALDDEDATDFFNTEHELGLTKLHLPKRASSLNRVDQSHAWNRIKSLKIISSKYDFVKVRVYLSKTHYYVLSRFLVNRVLTATQIKYHHAIRIALDLKKSLVDQGRLDITQVELETELFRIMNEYHYGENNIQLYRMMSTIHHHRIPIIVLIAATACIDKSTVATRLAERLNLPCVMKTDLIFELLASIHGHSPRSCILNYTKDLFPVYQEECHMILKSLNVDITKYISEGKSFIIEGVHVQQSFLQSILTCIKSSRKKGIVVPFLLTIENEKDHLQCIQEFVESSLGPSLLQSENDPSFCLASSAPFPLSHGRPLPSDRPFLDESNIAELVSNLYQNFTAVQSFLNETNTDFIKVPVNHVSLSQTLDFMHSHILMTLEKQFDALVYE